MPSLFLKNNSEDQIGKELIEAGLNPTGKTKLYDGRTGDAY